MSVASSTKQQRLVQRQEQMRLRQQPVPAAPAASRPFSGNSLPELLTPREAAAVLRVSPSTISRVFKTVRGVVDLSQGPASGRRRVYRQLRIPQPVLTQWIADHSGGRP